MASRRHRPRHTRRNRRSKHFTALLTDLATIDFTAASVHLASDQIYMPSHGFHTGSGPVQATTTGTLPTGLVTSTDYYFIRVDDHRVKLAASLVDANAGTAIDLSALGSGVHTLTWTAAFTAANTDICTAATHGLLTGDGPFQATNAGGALPAGLAALTDYWIVKLTANTFSLASSYANAIAGTPVVVDITGAGTGTHALTRATASGIQSIVGEQSCFWAHRLMTGDGPFRLTTSSALPTGLSTSTDYWVIKASADAVQWATTKVHAIAGTAINLTNAGSGSFVATAGVAAVQWWLKRGRAIRELKAID